METFLQQTARSIIEKTDWKQLSRTTFVLPSHRAGLVLKDELLRLQQERQAKVIWAPTVLTLPQLQDALSPLYPEDELMTVVRLYKHYRRLNAGDPDLMPLDMFYEFGRQMIADFTNVDVSMRAEQVPNFFDNTIAARELGEWRLDAEVVERLRALIDPMAAARDQNAEDDSIRRQYEKLWRQLYDLYQALQEELVAEHKGYPGMRQRAVLTHWEDESVQEQIEGRMFVFVGFNYLLPVERELMARLKDSDQALFYWDYVRDFETNTKAFSFAQLNSGILGAALPPRSWDEVREVHVLSCVSREAQAQYVHRWLQTNYTAKGQRVGIVIGDETMLEAVIHTLPAITLPGNDKPEPINITKGFPLRNTDIYLRTLNWLSSKDRGAAAEVVQPELIDQLIAALFPVINMQGDAISSEENEYSTEPDSPETKPKSLGELRWQELLVLESEYQVRKILNQMRLLITTGLGDVPFTLKLLRLLVRRTMEAVTLPFHGEPVTDIQVMGVLETRLLDFDKLLILNVEEGVLPQKQRDGSFIPFYLRKAFHMQTPEERATVYAYNFFRLISRTGDATLLYATAETAEGGKGMSRFILQMKYSDEFRLIESTLSERSVLAPIVDSIGEEEEAPSLLSLLTKDAQGRLRRKSGAPYRLSPSALNTYISCPRSFYMQYILGLRPKEDEEVLFAPNTLGSFVHHAMEHLYREYLHCDNTAPVLVSPDEIEAIRTDETKLQQALTAAYQAMNALWQKDHPEESAHYVMAHHTSENVVILGYVSNILERDREDAKAGLQIYLLEKELMFPIQIDGVGEILSGGTIDRMDIYGAPGEERLRVVDYKSGSYNDTTHEKKMTATWEDLMVSEDKGYVRQTLVYSHAVKANNTASLPIEPNLYFCRRKLTDIETTIDVENATVRDYAVIAGDFIATLQTKAKELLTANTFPQCDEDKCPAFCPFFDLCGRKPKDF